MLGLSGQDPEYIPVENIDAIINWNKNEINLGNEKLVPFISSRHRFQ
jgi:L-serine dehydratase